MLKLFVLFLASARAATYGKQTPAWFSNPARLAFWSGRHSASCTDGQLLLDRDILCPVHNHRPFCICSWKAACRRKCSWLYGWWSTVSAYVHTQFPAESEETAPGVSRVSRSYPAARWSVSMVLETVVCHPPTHLPLLWDLECIRQQVQVGARLIRLSALMFPRRRFSVCLLLDAVHFCKRTWGVHN